MVRSKEAAVALAESAFNLNVATITTVIDKAIDDQFTGANTVTLALDALADLVIQAEVQELYEVEGWTVVLTDLGAGSWQIDLS